MLAVRDLDVFIDGSHVLRRVALDLRLGEAVCLVGPQRQWQEHHAAHDHGLPRPAAGTITFNGAPIAGQPTHAIAARGLGFSPEDSGIFADLTVAENIEIATWTRPGGRPPAERVALAYEIFPRLRGYASRGGTAISGGERKMLSIARALALDPELLLLDEPFEGLSPAIISGHRRGDRGHPASRARDPHRRIEHPPRPDLGAALVCDRARRDHLRRVARRRPARRHRRAHHRRKTVMSSLPLLPTSVVGSHGKPSWWFTLVKAHEAGEAGPGDLEEMFDDAADTGHPRHGARRHRRHHRRRGAPPRRLRRLLLRHHQGHPAAAGAPQGRALGLRPADALRGGRPHRDAARAASAS
jgi:branched-chain amino acid transport system ATP-binding protein